MNGFTFRLSSFWYRSVGCLSNFFLPQFQSRPEKTFSKTDKKILGKVKSWYLRSQMFLKPLSQSFILFPPFHYLVVAVHILLTTHHRSQSISIGHKLIKTFFFQEWVKKRTTTKIRLHRFSAFNR